MAQALADDVCGRPPTEAALRKSHEEMAPCAISPVR